MKCAGMTARQRHRPAQAPLRPALSSTCSMHHKTIGTLFPRGAALVLRVYNAKGAPACGGFEFANANLVQRLSCDTQSC